MEHSENPKNWARTYSQRIGTNVRDYRNRLGLSAQKLSDATATLGYPIPRSTIANLEAGRKETIPVQEVAVLAEALRVPLAAVLFSPLRPGEEVHPIPSLPRPNFAAYEDVVRVDMSDADRQHDLTLAVHLMRSTAANRTARAGHLEQLDRVERALRDAEQGVMKATPDGPVFEPTPQSKLESMRATLRYLHERIEECDATDADNVEMMENLGIEPWPLEEHFVLPDPAADD